MLIRLADNIHNRLSQRQKELATGIAILGMFLLGFCGGEVTLRAATEYKFGFVGQAGQRNFFYQDPVSGLRRMAEGKFRNGALINNAGFRGQMVPVPKPPDTVRLAFLGTSTTLDQPGNWPALTSRLMQERFPSCRLDHINAGNPAHHITAAGLEYAHHLTPLDPDVVTIRLNDFIHDAVILARQTGLHQKYRQRKSWLAKQSLLWAKIEKRIQIIRRQRLGRHGLTQVGLDAVAMAVAFEVELEKLVRSIQSDGRFVLLIAGGGQLRPDQSPVEKLRAARTFLSRAPYLHPDSILEGRAAYIKAMESVAERTAAMYINIDSAIPPDHVHYADTVHFREPGSRLMARSLSDTLLRSPAFFDWLAARAPQCALD